MEQCGKGRGWIAAEDGGQRLVAAELRLESLDELAGAVVAVEPEVVAAHVEPPATRPERPSGAIAQVDVAAAPVAAVAPPPVLVGRWP